MKISDSLKLPCGVELSNRLGKSAMSENMALPGHIPGREFSRLYENWTQSGIGLLISGNVMVDPNYLGEPNNVVIHKSVDNFSELSEWGAVSTNETQIWLQLNHPGKQTPSFLCPEPVAPSAIPLNPPLDKMFNTPKELSVEQIDQIFEQFRYAALQTKNAGFHGVQIHGAHGYLVSQFLSPRHNQRKDEYGGGIEKRVEFVSKLYKRMRSSVGDDFPLGIKLNSADFSKGGFTHEESVFVAKHLSDLGMDLIEISGGSYEKPAMVGEKISESTKMREAYFLEYAEGIKEKINCPLMVTGGFRSGEFIYQTLAEKKVDLIGLGRPLCLEPHIAKDFLAELGVISKVKPIKSPFKWIDKLLPLEIIWYTGQIHRMGKGKKVKPNAGVLGIVMRYLFEFGVNGLKRTRAK